MHPLGRKLSPLLLVGAVFLGGPTAPGSGCPENTICAADPGSIVAAMQAEGYQAKLGTAKDGDPMIDSGASGYDFTVQFYDCTEGKDCKSIQFLVIFKDDGTNTPELANRWNKAKRFVQMAARDNGSLWLSYDVTTVGGLNQANFADTIDWWAVMLSQARQFFSESPDSAGS
ncbi:MAG: YbjN domain-containing protein [Novosphingobium sp.]|nr:YbjN domain-containing protein [Novosphingobium sp.]